MLSGLGFLPGKGDLLLEVEVWDDERAGAEGTAEEARREGFLCVWVEGSTLRRCEVTLEPEEEICENTAPMSADGALPLGPEVPFGGMGGGGGALSKLGSGGGGGGPGADEAEGFGVWPDWTS